jgi:F-box/leucine-rich repeat protein 2/20
MQHIILDFCDQISDEGLRALSAGCPNLQRINLQMCEQISDEGLRALSMGCPKIVIMEIYVPQAPCYI